MSRARVTVAALALSASGLIGIAVSEGWRDSPYADAVGVQTVGFGSTTKIQGRISVEQGLVRLGSDVSEHERALRQCLGDTKLSQNEWDALVSWAFNVGVHCDSTLIRKAKAGDYDGMCNELPRWNRAGGRVLPGLVKRREQERRLCLGQ